MRRRSVLALLAGLPVLLFAESAYAGSYLNRAALLLEGSRQERDMVWSRYADKELLRVVHGIAQARTRTAHSMEVPTAIASAHPHLLLILENCERAYAAALDGSHEKFLEHLIRARREDTTFRAIVEKLGYTIPAP